jgi:hypothetical protein
MELKTIELVLDIETIKMDFDKDFTAFEQAYLTKYDKEGEKFTDRMALYPQTGMIVAIGAKNIITGKGFVIYQTPGLPKEERQLDKNITHYTAENEKEILEIFWSIIRKMEHSGYNFNRLISFNGKSFDVPFILMRSAANGIKCHHTLGYKAQSGFHTDLLEETTFIWKVRKFKLELIAKTLGIPYHKAEDYNGKIVWEWFAAGEYDKIARYNYDDVELTEKIYLRLKDCWPHII